MLSSPESSSGGERSPLSDITNRQPGSQASSDHIPGFGSADPLNGEPGQFETPHDFFSEDSLLIQVHVWGRPQRPA